MSSISNFNNNDGGFTGFWIIENFSLWEPNKNLILKSKKFGIDALHNSKWNLEIYQEENNLLGIYIRKLKAPPYLNVRLAISVKTIFGWVPTLKNIHCKFTPNVATQGYSNLEWDKILKHHHLYLPNDSLTISFHIFNQRLKARVSHCLMISKMINKKELKHLSIENLCLEEPENLECFPAECARQFKGNVKDHKNGTTIGTQTSLITNDETFKNIDDLISFFKESKFSFVTLRTKDKDFMVHKPLLCTRSHVFNAMFEAEENSCSILNIDDLDNETLSFLLKFLHLEPLEGLDWCITVKLLYAAEKYEIASLKEECFIYLKKKMSTDNICGMFVLADKYQNLDLMCSALEFFFENSKIILRLQEWKDLLQNHTGLASAILSAFTKRISI